MTTWLDTPDVALGSAHDSIDFLVDGDGVAIWVSYDDGSEEPAYYGNAFRAPYLGSTRNGNTFALRRTGGWPATPTVHVDDVKRTAWTSIYEIDFTAEDSQTFWDYLEGPVQDARTFELAGISWELWNGVSSTYGQYLISGQGLKLHGSGRGWPGYPKRFDGATYMAFDLEQLPGYVAGRPTAVLARMTANNTGSGAKEYGPVIFARDAYASTSWPASGGVYCLHSKGNANIQRFGGATERHGGHVIAPSAAFDRVLGVVKQSGVYGYGLVGGAWTGAFPTPESMDPVAGDDNPVEVNGPMWAGVVAALAGDTDATRHSFCSHLRVLQVVP